MHERASVSRLFHGIYTLNTREVLIWSVETSTSSLRLEVARAA